MWIINKLLKILRLISTIILIFEFVLVCLFGILGFFGSFFIFVENFSSIGGVVFVTSFIGVILFWYSLISAKFIMLWVLLQFPLHGNQGDTFWWAGVFFGVSLSILVFLSSVLGFKSGIEVVELFSFGIIFLIPFVHTMIEFGLQNRDWLKENQIEQTKHNKS